VRRESVKDEDPDDVASPPLLMAFDLPYPEVPERLAATRSVAKSRNQHIVDRAPFYSLNHVLRVMLHTHWSAEAWSQVRVEFKKALALLSEIRRAGWFNRRLAKPVADSVSRRDKRACSPNTSASATSPPTRA